MRGRAQICIDACMHACILHTEREREREREREEFVVLEAEVVAVCDGRAKHKRDHASFSLFEDAHHELADLGLLMADQGQQLVLAPTLEASLQVHGRAASVAK